MSVANILAQNLEYSKNTKSEAIYNCLYLDYSQPNYFIDRKWELVLTIGSSRGLSNFRVVVFSLEPYLQGL